MAVLMEILVKPIDITGFNHSPIRTRYSLKITSISHYLGE